MTNVELSARAPPTKILLVDDDAFNREGVRLYLARAGFDVLEAGDTNQRVAPSISG